MEDLPPGRDADVEVAARFLAQVRDGRSGVLTISGPAGIGKTTLWRHVVARAGAERFRVLSARPLAAEAPVAFSVLTDLLRGVEDEVLDALPWPQAAALRVVTLRAAPASWVDPRAVHAAALGVVGRLAEQGPVLVAVDDLAWVDASSARVLEYVARRLEHQPVGVVTTSRTGEPSDGAPWQLTTVGAPATRLELGPLDLAATTTVVERHLGRRLPRRTAQRVHAVSGGNPFYALQLADHLPRTPTTGTPYRCRAVCRRWCRPGWCACRPGPAPPWSRSRP